MTAKEYLKQAYVIDREINSLLEHLMKTRSLAEKTTASMSDAPGSPSRDTSKMEDAVIKLIEQQEAIDARVDALVDLKREMGDAIDEVPNADERQVLRLRYLALLPWKDVARVLHYDVRQVYRIHVSAVKNFRVPKTCQF